MLWIKDFTEIQQAPQSLTQASSWSWASSTDAITEPDWLPTEYTAEAHEVETLVVSNVFGNVRSGPILLRTRAAKGVLRYNYNNRTAQSSVIFKLLDRNEYTDHDVDSGYFVNTFQLVVESSKVTQMARGKTPYM